MFKPNELEAIPLELESQFKDLENRIMQDIVRRLKNNGNEIIRSADWQLHRLNELGKSKDEIKQFIFETLDLSEKEIERIYSDVLEQGYAHDERLYKSIGKNMIPFSENEQLQQLISAITEQTNDELKNITQSLGFAVKQPDGTLKFQPIAEYYQKTLDGAMMDISSGAFDYNTVLKRIVSEMTNSGLRLVDYASGWSNRVPVAARRAVMTGLNQLTAKVNDDNAQQLDTDMFEISWHSGYRPDHWWGGRWYTKEQLISVCGLGTGAGLCGWNCYHNYSPVIPGVSEPTYTQEQLDLMNAREQEKRSFYGKEYNVYEATQRQRKLETAMRAQRQKIKLLEDGGADEDDIITARAKYRGMSQEYTAFSKAMDLPQQRERITIDGLGNIGVGKWKKQLKNQTESGIITANNKLVGNDVHYVCRINKDIYNCVTNDIVTDEVIITEERIRHIKDRHPNDYEKYCEYMAEIVRKPQYIIEANKANTALLLKSFEDGNIPFKTVLRLVTSSDNPEFKNSIITFMKINDKEWNRLIKNKKILYKSE